MTTNNRERTYEYTISFDSANCEKVAGGFYIHGVSIHLARKRENPSVAKRRARKEKNNLLKSI